MQKSERLTKKANDLLYKHYKKQQRRKTEKQWHKDYKNLEINFIATNYSDKRFYKTQEWRQLRYRALKELGNICMLCGASRRTGAIIHVDHILPRSIYPEKALDIDNLQILCEDCNLGKSNKDGTDWR